MARTPLGNTPGNTPGKKPSNTNSYRTDTEKRSLINAKKRATAKNKQL
jgi:hypothetical protein